MAKQEKKGVEDQFWGNVESFADYWRLNIHRFVGEYLGIQLFFFQKILLYMMDAPYTSKLNKFIFFASRGLGKVLPRLSEKQIA